jgi:hypothetical protein
VKQVRLREDASHFVSQAWTRKQYSAGPAQAPIHERPHGLGEAYGHEHQQKAEQHKRDIQSQGMGPTPKLLTAWRTGE